MKTLPNLKYGLSPDIEYGEIEKVLSEWHAFFDLPEDRELVNKIFHESNPPTTKFIGAMDFIEYFIGIGNKLKELKR